MFGKLGLGLGLGGGGGASRRMFFYPGFSLPGGIYDADTEAPLSLVLSAIAGEIVYTSDNTLPNKNSTKYVNPIIISRTTTIKAQAWEGKKYSYVGERTYKILPPEGYTENTIFADSEDVFGWNSTDAITFGRTEVPENVLFANSKEVFGYNSTDIITFGRTEV